MSTLLALSIGPVQEFIASARRTRDLWFGSTMLSELSRKAAQTVEKGKGRLIFPTSSDANPKVDSATVSVANIILAELPAGAYPASIAKNAKAAVQQRWEAFAADAHQVIAGKAKGRQFLDEDLWRIQLRDAIEFYAAWTSLDSKPYKDTRARVMRLLAGRKACRDFSLAQGKWHIPKSSLDGRRESVIVKSTSTPSPLRLELRLNPGEQLCAIGLTKRLAEGKPSYPSVSRIAADPWLRKVANSAKTNPKIGAVFGQLDRLCSKLSKRGCLYALKAERFPQFSYFPYEGTCLFPNRYTDWQAETGLTDADVQPVSKVLDDLKKFGLGEPDPYLAILVADGDHMGQLLSKIEKLEQHQTFSQGLTVFAKEAYGIVQKRKGVCVFAGGDDVLAFTPLDQSLECARELRDRFTELKKFVPDGSVPTFSVGIAIGHCMEPLEDLRNYGLEAEKAAKHPTLESEAEGLFAERDGLAIKIHPRSGVAFGVREQWQDNETSLDLRILDWARLFNLKKLPQKLPYNLRKLALELKDWPRSGGAPAEAVAAEIRVLLKRKQVEKSFRQQLEDKLKLCCSAEDLLRLAEEMLVAQRIATAQSSLDNPQEGNS